MVKLPSSGLVFVIEVPRLEWIDLFEKVWQKRLQKGVEPADGNGRNWYRNSSWVAWWTDEEPTRADRKREAETFAKAIAGGRNCVGIAVDLEWLPRDLVLSADHRITVAPPTGKMLKAASRLLTKASPCTRVNDEQTARATPRLLRLAYRPDRQSADDYLRKLAELIEQDTQAEKPKPASPRNEPTLDRLHGMDEAVAWCLRVRDDLLAVQAGRITWSELDRGCLLSGPPGCGKTLFARALAATCGIPLISGSYSQWMAHGSGHQGDLLRALRGAFTDAKRQAPSILFIDEVDSFPDRESVTHNWRDWEVQVVNALLTEIDGVDGRDGVILVGACNHPDRLDPALTRSGRLDRHIRISLPGPSDVERILREHLGSELTGEDLRRVVLWATGMSGADLERVIREARQRARFADRPLVLEDLEWVVSGKNHPELRPDVLWLVCIHEAGHAVVALDQGFQDLDSVAIGHDGKTSLGRTNGFIDKPFMTAQDVQARVMLLLAGRAAEEVFLGQPSSGAGGHQGSDLAQATMLLLCAHTMLGLGSDLPPLWLGEVDRSSLPVLLASQPTIAISVIGQIDKAYEDLKHLVRRRWDAIHQVALALWQKRVLHGAEVKAIVARHPPRMPSHQQEPLDTMDATYVGRE